MRSAVSSIRAIPVILAFGLLAGPLAAGPEADSPIAVESSPSLVTFAGTVGKSGDPGQLKVRIAGPAGDIVFESVSKSGLLDWVADPGLRDGLYRWDAWIVPAGQAKRQPSVHYRSGKLRIRNGVIQVDGGREVSAAHGSPGLFEALVGRALESMVPAARAAASHNDAAVILDNEDDGRTYVALDSDTAQGAFNVRWQIWNFDERLEFNTFSGGNKMTLTTDSHLGIGTNSPAVPLQISDATPRLRFQDTDGFDGSGPTAWTISASGDEFRLQDNDGGSRPFIVDAGGESSGAPLNSLFIASGDGDIGLGTSTPDSPLHITDASPQIRFERSGSNSWLSGTSGASAERFFIGTNVFSQQFFIERSAPHASLAVTGSGDIGMGTGSPDSPLHLQRSDGNAEVFVEETSGTAAPRVLYRMHNNGAPILNFQNNNAGANGSWTYTVTDAGGFRVNASGSGAPIEMDLFEGGDMTIGGTLTEGSSRAIKDDITPVDGDTVLAKLDNLPLSEWSYESDSADRHVGPMAEDFYAIFGLGPDNKHIAPKDLAGVALAAVKALKAQNDELQTRVAELEAKLADEH